MTLIFRVAAGILIGLLATHAVMINLYNKKVDDGLSKGAVFLDRQVRYSKYKSKYLDLRSAIVRYYDKNNKIPNYMADLECRNRLGMPVNSCADVLHDGEFFVNYQGLWAGLKPYVDHGFLRFECRMDYGFVQYDDDYLLCDDIAEAIIPEPNSPSFECNKARTKVEKMICSSDRLIDLDLKLDDVYQKAVKRRAAVGDDVLRKEQIKFISKRESVCSDSKCIEEITKNRIGELEL